MPLFHWPATPLRSYGVRKMNRYTVTSTRWFGGTSLYFACVMYQLRINGAWVVTHMFGFEYPKIWSLGAAFTAKAIIANVVFTPSYLKSTRVKLITGLCQLTWAVTPGSYANIGNLYIGMMASLYWTVSQKWNVRDQVQGFCLPTVSHKALQAHLSCKSMKEKALAGYHSQQIPNNNDIQRMLTIVISLRWMHYCYYIISVSNPNNELYNIKGT